MGCGGVARRQDRIVDRPADAAPWVVPSEAARVVLRVTGSALVVEEGGAAEDHEPMGEAGRHEELVLVLRGERHPVPAAERRRGAPQVDGDIPDLALPHRHQSALRGGVLALHPTQRATPRKGEVVLREFEIAADGAILLPTLGYREEFTVIAKDGGLDQQQPGQVAGGDSHPGPAGRDLGPDSIHFARTWWPMCSFFYDRLGLRAPTA